ncbi:MAG: hypothetical protein V3V09_01760 [Arenicellales bacterium]
MKAVLAYVKTVIASGTDGTISITTDSGAIATLTIVNTSISSASFGDISGQKAVDAIKASNIIHMELWTDIIHPNQIKKMLDIQQETNAMAPMPKGEMRPNGAPLSSEIIDLELELETDLTDSQSIQLAQEDTSTRDTLTPANISALSKLLIDYLGPAAPIFIEEATEQTQNIDKVIRLISAELFTEEEKAEFIYKAYATLSKGA